MSKPLSVLRCANCGADVAITSPATVSVTCDHCGTLSLRGDVDLTAIGEVAFPTPLTSRFQIGTEGSYGSRSFVVRGQIQLDHGAGRWNEWAAETERGWLWIAEAQGEIQVFEEVEGARVPDRDRLPDIDHDSGSFIPPHRKDREHWRAGDGVDVDEGGRWTIREIGRGTVVTFRGELPIRLEAGTRTTYIDLCRGAHEVATLDFTRPGDAEFLRGRVVAADELRIDPSTQPEFDAAALKSTSVQCMNCGGTIEVQDSERALSLGCQHCGTLMQRSNQSAAYRAIEGEARIKSRPSIPIGSVGEVGGEELTVLGFLERSVRSDGVRYPWREYLTRNSDGQYRWLVESDGHWTLARPVTPTRLRGGGGKVSLGGQRARSFTSGDATVDEVLGEFYWEVKAGSSVRAKDFIAPKLGLMASFETTPLEAASSLGQHVERSAIEEAFPAADLPRAVGVGAVQPNPHAPKAAWRIFALLFILLTGSCIATRASSANEVVHAARFGPIASAVDTEKVDFTEPFDIRSDGRNVRVTLRAGQLDGGYIGFLGALVNEDTGEVHTFRTAAQYYSGVSGGERWTEGNRRGRVLMGPIPAGRYRMRIATRPFDKGVSQPYEVEVRSDVPRTLWYVLALLLLIPVPMVIAARAGAFEARRWANAD